MSKNKKESLVVPFVFAVSSFYLAGKVADSLYKNTGCEKDSNEKNLATGLALSGASYMAVRSVSNENSTVPVAVLIGTLSSYLFSYSKYKGVCDNDFSKQIKSENIAAYFKKEKEKRRSVRYVEPDLT